MEDDILSRFETGGFDALRGKGLAELAEFLENNAADTGWAAPLFVAQALWAIGGLFHEQDEYGGVRIGFIEYVDRVVRTQLKSIKTMPGPEAAKSARQLRDEVLTLVGAYDPSSPGGL